MTDLPQISHSQLTSWRSCEQRWGYAYDQRLTPKRIDRPMHLGSWVHACLETHYKGEGWRVGHEKYLKAYNKMPKLEQLRLDRQPRQTGDDESLEPLPSQVERIVRSYLWYEKRQPPTETLAVEVKFSLDRGFYTLIGVIDRIYRDENGIIVIQDHKVPGELPDQSAFHTMDPQLTIYFEGAREALGVEAEAIEYNYLVSKAPSFPKQNKDLSISRAAIVTDYPTAFRWFKEHGFDPAEYTGFLAPLMAESPMLKKYRMTRNQKVVESILADCDRTAQEILDHDGTVRNIDRNCNRCPYAAVCRGELFGFDVALIKRRDFKRKVARR